MEITEFLLARIAEDEAAANADDFDLARIDGIEVINEAGRRRVLAECEAKRRIVGLHPVEPHGCPTVDGGQEWREDACDTLLIIALPYSHRPDYRREWAL